MLHSTGSAPWVFFKLKRPPQQLLSLDIFDTSHRLLGAPTLQLCPLILPFPLWLMNWGEPHLQQLSAPLRGHQSMVRTWGILGTCSGELDWGERWHTPEMLRVWCPGRELCPCGMLRLTSLSESEPPLPPFFHNIHCFTLTPGQLCLRWPCWPVVAVNRPEPISQLEHLILCAMTKAEPSSPACRLAAGGCREGGEVLSALNRVAGAGRYCWMAWISSLPVVRQTVGCFLGGACAGGTRAEQIWAGCRCPFHLGAVVLLCRRRSVFSLPGSCWFVSSCCCF